MIRNNRYAEILKSIQFHSIPAALLFGSKLKLQLEKEGIESKVLGELGEINGSLLKIFEGVEPIVHIIEELLKVNGTFRVGC